MLEPLDWQYCPQRRLIHFLCWLRDGVVAGEMDVEILQKLQIHHSSTFKYSRYESKINLNMLDYHCHMLVGLKMRHRSWIERRTLEHDLNVTTIPCLLLRRGFGLCKGDRWRKISLSTNKSYLPKTDFNPTQCKSSAEALADS